MTDCANSIGLALLVSTACAGAPCAAFAGIVVDSGVPGVGTTAGDAVPGRSFFNSSTVCDNRETAPPVGTLKDRSLVWMLTL